MSYIWSIRHAIRVFWQGFLHSFEVFRCLDLLSLNLLGKTSGLGPKQSQSTAGSFVPVPSENGQQEEMDVNQDGSVG